SLEPATSTTASTTTVGTHPKSCFLINTVATLATAMSYVKDVVEIALKAFALDQCTGEILVVEDHADLAPPALQRHRGAYVSLLQPQSGDIRRGRSHVRQDRCGRLPERKSAQKVDSGCEQIDPAGGQPRAEIVRPHGIGIGERRLQVRIP